MYLFYFISTFNIFNFYLFSRCKYTNYFLNDILSIHIIYFFISCLILEFATNFLK